jgi:glycosyltransferase involved in cell wall biosynthesis
MNQISVIIPAFNAAATLAEALSSVLNQTRPPDEIIVINDGSTDATAEIARATPGVLLLQQVNSGVASAMNLGLMSTQCDLVAFLDADDMWMPGCLEIHKRNLFGSQSFSASVGCFVEFVCPSASPIEAARYRPRPTQPGWFAGATVQPRANFTHVGSFNSSLRAGAWIDWVDRARRAGVSFNVLDELVLRRRLRPGSLSTRHEVMSQSLIEVARLALARRRANA